MCSPPLPSAFRALAQWWPPDRLRPSLGEVAGHLAGDLKAALVKAGLPEAEAGRWRAQIESGEMILLGVHARGGVDSRRVEAALMRHSAGPVVATEWDAD